MTDSYHFQIEPEPRAELNCGEFVLTADGGLHRRTHWDHLVTLSAADVSWYGWRDAEALARHLESQEYKRRDSIVFPSGASILTSGDKIVGRVEAEPDGLPWDNIKPGAIINISKPVQYITGGASAAVDPLSAVIARLAASIDADLLKLLSPAPEPKRAPLPHFNQRTEFDPFPDYVVFHEFEPVAPLHTSPTTDSAYPAIAGLLRG